MVILSELVHLCQDSAIIAVILSTLWTEPQFTVVRILQSCGFWSHMTLYRYAIQRSFDKTRFWV